MFLVLRPTVLGVALLGLVAGILAFGPVGGPEQVSAAPAVVNPLDRVPADAGLFAHFQAGDLWNHPAVAELRKSYVKELEPVLQNLEKVTGLRPEQIQSA